MLNNFTRAVDGAQPEFKMTKIAEYGSFDSSLRSVRTVLATVNSPRVNNRQVNLIHCTEGYEPAGSMARWTEEKWLVNYMIDGATHGKSFFSYDKAQAEFKRYCITQAEFDAEQKAEAEKWEKLFPPALQID